MASATIQRTNVLTKRVTSLKERTSKLNPTVEEVSLDDIGAYKPFKSNSTKDPSFSHQRPKAVVDVYNSGQPVPAFSRLNQFRDDGKDCVKMYTNPDFFFELWSNQIKKEVNEKKPKRKKRQAQVQAAVTVRAPKNVRLLELKNKVERENAPPPVMPKPGQPTTPSPTKSPSLDNRNAAPPSGELPSPPPDIRRKPTAPGVPQSPRDTGGSLRKSTPTHRPNIPPPPPPPPGENSATDGRYTARDSTLPPPPPSPPAMNGGVQSRGDLEQMDVMPPPPPVLRVAPQSAKRGTLYSVGDFDRNTAFFPPPPPSTAPQPPPPVATDGPAPPPPPPPPGPPPPVTYCAPPPATGSILPTPESAFQLRSVAPVAQKKRESRGDLLLSIRAGITLRKVEETQRNEAKQPAGGGLFDVQTILEMRRKAMEEDSDEEEEETSWDE